MPSLPPARSRVTMSNWEIRTSAPGMPRISRRAWSITGAVGPAVRITPFGSGRPSNRRTVIWPWFVSWRLPKPELPTEANIESTPGSFWTIPSFFWTAAFVSSSAVPTGSFRLTLKSPLSVAGISSRPTIGSRSSAPARVLKARPITARRWRSAQWSAPSYRVSMPSRMRLLVRASQLLPSIETSPRASARMMREAIIGTTVSAMMSDMPME